MNTDAEGRNWVMPCLPLDPCPVNGYSSWKQQLLSSLYPCLSVFICGLMLLSEHDAFPLQSRVLEVEDETDS